MHRRFVSNMELGCPKRSLGAFYTPEVLSDILCQWAITDATNTVLEPSFGGCGFLQSAKSTLTRLGQPAPVKQLYGCDIDPRAFGHLQSILSQPVDTERFHLGDFLAVKPHETWPAKFSAVVGNPPYLPYRKIDRAARARARAILSAAGFDIDLRASLWAYFVALSCQYVETGGRTAWILPSSFLHANYAIDLRKFLARQFPTMRAFELEQRFFVADGTEEKTIVLLAANKVDQTLNVPNASTDIDLVRCKGLEELTEAIQNWDNGYSERTLNCGTSVADGLQTDARALMADLAKSTSATLLGDHVDIRIGLVTGNNKFFVLDESTRRQSHLNSNELLGILSKFKYARGLQFEEADHAESLRQGGRGYLVSCTTIEEASEYLKEYLNSYSLEDRKQCATFRKRSVWHHPDDGNVPDAFFPVMHHGGPRLVLNEGKYPCTNTIHRAFFKSDTGMLDRKLTSLTLLSSFSQISSEIEGRSYGAGVLKHEPREAERILILKPKIHGNTINSVYRQADILLRSGKVDGARQLVDASLFEALGRTNASRDIEILDSALREIRSLRHR